jgi:hypothetical protein
MDITPYVKLKILSPLTNTNNAESKVRVCYDFYSWRYKNNHVYKCRACGIDKVYNGQKKQFEI